MSRVQHHPVQPELNEPGYVSNATPSEVARRVGRAERIAIVSHQKADGDAVGSMLALQRALTQRGRQAAMFTTGPLEPNLRLIIGRTPFRRVEESPAPGDPGDDYDTVLVVDTGAWSQMGDLEPWLRRHHDRAIIIDHHARGDADMAPLRLIDETRAATTQLLVPVLDAMGCPLTGGIGGVAEALFVGLATDTGWFRHCGADAEVFELAARLLRQGIDKSRLYQILEETHRPQRLALEAKALGSLEYARGGAVAVMSLTLEDFKNTGGVVEDLTGLVNLPLIVGAVRVAVLLAQTEPGLTKISLRSKPPIPNGEPAAYVDVNELARQFGGGGHVHAAGARIEADLEPAKARLRRVLEGD